MLDREDVPGKNPSPPMKVPFPHPILEDLEHSWPNIMFCVKPRERCIGVEGCFPQEATILLKLHTEERIRQGSEVIVVDASVDKGRWKADL